MIKSHSNIEPQLVQRYGKAYLINFNVTQNEIKTMEGETHPDFEYEQVKVPLSASRADVIAAIIHNAYTIDDELATINNYLADPDEANVQQEYEEYQARRAFAKSLADGVMDLL